MTFKLANSTEVDFEQKDLNCSTATTTAPDLFEWHRRFIYGVLPYFSIDPGIFVALWWCAMAGWTKVQQIVAALQLRRWKSLDLLSATISPRLHALTCSKRHRASSVDYYAAPQTSVVSIACRVGVFWLCVANSALQPAHMRAAELRAARKLSTTTPPKHDVSTCSKG